MISILAAVLTLTILGLLFGLLLAVGSKIFAVEQDERIPMVQECLPGANCGGCGYAGCANLAEAIVNGENVPQAGVPESFKVLVKELQSLGLDVKVLDANNEEIDLKQNFDEDDDIGLATPIYDSEAEGDLVVDDLTGYGLQDENGDDIVEGNDDDDYSDDENN